MFSVSTILAIMALVAKVYVALDDWRLKAQGAQSADAAANKEQLARIQKALAARVAFVPDSVPDPYNRDSIH